MPSPERQPHTRLDIQAAASDGQKCQVTLQGGTVLWIPVDVNNEDYQALLGWESSGGTIADL